ncbi:hypothetical protein C3941_03760 [Kaistia algarum]|uniref:DUF2955 domain-containing protein n=1 Tax=Kaistia algarum TaxID=2083279 RepID=UPI000CE7EC84|nr:DUF2955 domain-containing protein [Kaistia algarum]MCX5512671.1 DUF2955 domain-containing protein [Kaistia algarum]PPE81818.1 hypothetical protein C3941_03760 [Kaistia algarum]
MRPEQPDGIAEALELKRERHFGLRLAFAVSAGFTAAIAIGSVLPFLAPMLALQFLVTSRRPLPLAAGIVMAAVVFVTGGALTLLVGLFNDRPVVLLLLIGLLFFFCFTAQALGKALPIVGLVLTISTVTIVLGMANIDLGQATSAVLLGSLAAGLLIAWAAHALFPEPAASGPGDAGSLGPAPAHPLQRAASNTLILLGSVLICFINPAFTTAIVVPLTVVSLINQADIAHDQKAIWGLLVVNVIGGLLASFAYTLLSMRESLVFMFLILLTMGLFLGGRAADPARGKVFAGSLGIFLVVFGLGVSPIPTTAPESFQTRMVMVLFAILYAIIGIGLLWRTEPHPRTETSP